MNQLLIEKTGEQQPEQVVGERGDDALGRQVFPVQMIDAADAGIGGDKLICELGDGFHPGDLPQNGNDTKSN